MSEQENTEGVEEVIISMPISYLGLSETELEAVRASRSYFTNVIETEKAKPVIQANRRLVRRARRMLADDELLIRFAKDHLAKMPAERFVASDGPFLSFLKYLLENPEMVMKWLDLIMRLFSL